MTSSKSNTHIYSSYAEFVGASDWNAHMRLVRYDHTDSPITLDGTMGTVIINTTGGAVTVNLPTENNRYKIKNKVDAGETGNDITLVSSVDIEDDTIMAGESADLVKEDTEGWIWL